jgi:hypothetical protein
MSLYILGSCQLLTCCSINIIIIIIWQNGRYFCSDRYILNVWMEGASSRACDIFLSDRKRNSGTRSLSNLGHLCCLVIRCRKPMVDNMLWVLNEVIYLQI